MGDFFNGAIDAFARVAVSLRAMLNGSASEDFAVKKLTAADTITPHSTKGIVGTTTNDAAQSGSVGEYNSVYVPAASGVALVSGVNTDITSLTLTAGDWELMGFFGVLPDASTSITVEQASISTSSATQNQQALLSINHQPIVTGGFGLSGALPTFRVSLSGSTTIYLVGRADFTIAGAKGFGAMRARRIR